MSSYLLDTDIFVYLLKHDQRVEAHTIAVGAGAIGISVITVAEVLHGAYFSVNPAQSLQVTQQLVSQYSVIELDTVIADKFGEIKAALRRQGQILADFDLLIGATAIVTGRTLVTNNTKHFQRLDAFGLTLENWKS